MDLGDTWLHIFYLSFHTSYFSILFFFPWMIVLISYKLQFIWSEKLEFESIYLQECSLYYISYKVERRH